MYLQPCLDCRWESQRYRYHGVRDTREGGYKSWNGRLAVQDSRRRADFVFARLYKDGRITSTSTLLRRGCHGDICMRFWCGDVPYFAAEDGKYQVSWGSVAGPHCLV